jgi:beta-lactamase class D
MVGFMKVLIWLLAFLVPTFAFADDQDIAKLYAQYGVEGTLIITSLNGQTSYVHNTKRAHQRFLPASTFKIPNTLIALDQGVIRDDKQIIPWDGQDKGLSIWNKDQTLSSAFQVSCIWCYQEFARQTGQETYLRYLSTLQYGNQKTGPNVTSFWLDGDLRISAHEQISFMRDLVDESLPFKKDHLKFLKRIMIEDHTPHYTLRAKSGWATRIPEQHGWYVGYIEVNNQTWLFANNIHINQSSDAKYRKKLVVEAFKAKGIID